MPSVPGGFGSASDYGIQLNTIPPKLGNIPVGVGSSSRASTGQDRESTRDLGGFGIQGND